MKTNLLFVVSVLLILECLPGKDIIPCIEGLNRCNGIRECEDGTDEANCTTQPLTVLSISSSSLVHRTFFSILTQTTSLSKGNTESSIPAGKTVSLFLSDTKELTTNELTTELRKSEVRIEETTPQLTTEPITPETTAEPTALDLTPLLTTSHLTTKPTTSDITTVPITSDLSAVPTTSEMTAVPIATTSEMTTVPKTYEMTTVPTTSEMTIAPKTYEMTTAPTSPELTTESVEPAFTTPKLTSISTAPILTTESSLQSDIPVSKSASKSARETTEKRSETTVSTPQIEKIVSISPTKTTVSTSKAETAVSMSYTEETVSTSPTEETVSTSLTEKTLSTSTTEETVSTSTTEEIVSTSTTEVKVSTSTTEETVSTSTTEETVSTSTTPETVSKSFIETTVMNTTSKDGILPAERSNTDYIFLYISIPILCILLNILLVFAWKQKFKMRERKHFYSMEREGLSTMSIRTNASVEAFPAENVLMTSALPHHETLFFHKIVTFYNPEYESSENTTVQSQSLGENVRPKTFTNISDKSQRNSPDSEPVYGYRNMDIPSARTIDNQENLNDDFDVSTNSRNVHIYSQPSNGASKCLDNEDSTDLSPMDADEQHKSYNILASENTIVPSRRNSSEFDFKTEYKCTNMDIPSAKTTDLHQKNLNNHCDVLTCSSNVPLSLQPSKLLDNEESKDLSPMNADVQYRSYIYDVLETFDTVDLHCNGIHLHCFVDERLASLYRDILKSTPPTESMTSNYNERRYNVCHSNAKDNQEKTFIHSEENKKVYAYETFATVDQHCNGIHLHCFVDKRLGNKYRDLLNSTSPTESMSINELFYALDKHSNKGNIKSEYVIISSLMRNHYERYLDQEILLVAVENKLSFVCRWLLSHIYYEDESIVRALSKSFEMGNNDTTKALAWTVTRQFYKKYQEILDKNALDIYPAYKCECHNASTEKTCLPTSKKLIAIEWNSNFLPNIPSMFLNFEITIFSYDDICNSNNYREKGEMKDILSEINKQFGSSSYSLSMPRIDGKIASNLFKQHRNLSLICPSPMKSTNYSLGHRVSKTQCIQLFCQRKGYIPLGETHFKAEIKGIPTDVLQGRGYFASTTLRIGDKIGTQTTCGTLGGFYRIAGKYEFFLTCAHVLYSLSTLLAPKDHLCHDVEVEVFLDPQHSNQQCGGAFRGVFKHDDPTRTSVDAGLVMIKSPDFRIDHNDVLRDVYGAPQPPSRLGLSSPYVHQNFCDHMTLCCTKETVSVVAPGAFTKKDQNVTFQQQTYKDVYFQDIGQINGHANGLTFQPLLIAQPAHMQLPVGSLTEKRIFTMYNQMVMNIPLQQGDSGTCIYITGNTPQNTGCVGMAIAFCSGSGLSLVTPIQDIICEIN